MAGAQGVQSCAHCGAEFPEDGLFCPMCGTPRAQATGAVSGDTLIGQVVGDRYLLHERVGEGGSGVIYRGEHVTLRRQVAIKLLHHKLVRDDLAIERFRREATTVGEIDNEHVVKVFDFGRAADGRLFFVMELLDGETLAKVLERERTLPVARVVDILTQLSEALMEAHAMGYVHRDLRPANVFLVTRKGRRDFVKLLDFGLSKLLTPEGEAAQTSLGMTFGDPRYMSPEQARGQTLDRRSDIYALGIIGYEMLCGKPPFGGQKTLDVLQKQLEVIPTPPSAVRKDVPPWLEAVVLRALSKRPEDRFVTVMRMIEAIREGQTKAASPAALAASFGPAAAPAPELQPAPEPDFRDTIPDPQPPKFAQTLMLSSSGQPEPLPPPPTHEEPLPEPVSMSQVPTVNAQPAASGAAPSSASQKWFQAGDAAPYPEGDEAAAPAPERSSARRAAAANAWDDDLVASGPPRAVKITIGVLAVALAALGAWMLWPRAKSAGGRSSGPSPAAVTVPASAQAPTVAAPARAATPVDAAVAVVALPEPTKQPAPERPKTLPALAKPARPEKSWPPQESATPAPKPAPVKVAGKKTLPPLKTRIAATTAPPDKPPPSAPAAPPKPSTSGILDPYDQPAASPSPTPEDAQAEGYVKMGRLFLQRNDFAKAAAAFNRAREYDPRNPDAIGGLGQISYQEGKYEDAAVHFRAAVRLAPQRASFRVWLGHALLGSGRPREAEAEYRAALKADPANASARQGLEAAQKR